MARRDLKRLETRDSRPETKILVLEDNPYHLELLTALLAREFPKVQIDTQQKSKPYRFIFCNSLEKIAPLQKSFPKTPILVLDSLSDETKAARAIKLGAEEYLPKNRATLEKLPSLLQKWRLKTPKNSQ